MPKPTLDEEFRRKRTLHGQCEELREAWLALGREVLKAFRPVLCRLRLHEFSAMHPHYCAACGRYYDLR